MEIQYKIIKPFIKYKIYHKNTVLCQPGPNIAHYENQRARKGCVIYLTKQRCKALFITSSIQSEGNHLDLNGHKLTYLYKHCFAW